MADYGFIIIIYLLTQLTPTDKNLKLTIEIDGNVDKISLYYNVKAKQWLAEEPGKSNENTPVFAVNKAKKSFILGKNVVSISDLVVDDAKINWKKATSVSVPKRDNMPNQSPIIITRNKKSIVLSQQQGDLSNLKNITISW